MGYVILENDDTLRLTAEVIQRMAKGWKPIGGVACYFNSSNRTVQYLQAMVSEAETPTEPKSSTVRGK